MMFAEFWGAALPWIALGIAVAVACTYAFKK